MVIPRPPVVSGPVVPPQFQNDDSGVRPPDLSRLPGFGGAGKVFVEFADIAAAREAQHTLNRRRYSGRKVVIGFYNEADFYSGNL